MLDQDKHKEIFSYPSQEEITAILNTVPNFEGFRFKWIEINNAYFKEEEAFEAFHNAPSWHSRINNKLTKLEFSYIQAKYHFYKGIPDSNWKDEPVVGRKSYFPQFAEEDKYKKFLFNFYCESFYYHYSSTLDILAHILCLYLNIKYKGKLHLNKVFIQSLSTKNEGIAKCLSSFLEKNESNSSDRNDFTHNYPINEIDNRVQKIEVDGKEVRKFNSIKYSESGEVMHKMDNASALLVALIRNIEKEL